MALRRILLIPHLGLSQCRSDSSYQGFIDMVKSNVNATGKDKCFFYMILPDWAQDPFPDEPNQMTMTVRMNKDFWISEMIGVEPEFLASNFCRRGGRYVIDMLYTEMVRPSWYMGQVLGDYRARHGVPVAVGDPIGISTVVNRTWEHQIANCMSYLHGYTVTDYGEDRDYYVGQIKQFFKPAYVEKFIDRLWSVNNGIDFDAYSKIAEEERCNKHEKISLFCGMRFNENKGIKFIMDVFKTLYASGRDVYIASTTGTAEVKGMQQIPGGDMSMLKTMKFSCKREEYIREASRCHVFLSASKDESFAMHIVEQLSLGLVGVVPDLYWVWECIPRNYPFVYRSGDRLQAYTVVSWCMDNYERAKAMIEPIVAEIRAKYNSKNSSGAMIDMFERRIDERFVDYKSKKLSFSKSGKFRFPFRLEVCDAADSLGESFSMDDLLGKLKSKMVGTDMNVFKRLGGPRMGVPTLYDIRMMLHSYGWEDACDGPEVRFVRGDNVTVPSIEYKDQIEEAKNLQYEMEATSRDRRNNPEKYEFKYEEDEDDDSDSEDEGQ